MKLFVSVLLLICSSFVLAAQNLKCQEVVKVPGIAESEYFPEQISFSPEKSIAVINTYTKQYFVRLSDKKLLGSFEIFNQFSKPLWVNEKKFYVRDSLSLSLYEIEAEGIKLLNGTGHKFDDSYFVLASFTKNNKLIATYSTVYERDDWGTGDTEKRFVSFYNGEDFGLIKRIEVPFFSDPMRFVPDGSALIALGYEKKPVYYRISTEDFSMESFEVNDGWSPSYISFDPTGKLMSLGAGSYYDISSFPYLQKNDFNCALCRFSDKSILGEDQKGNLVLFSNDQTYGYFYKLNLHSMERSSVQINLPGTNGSLYFYSPAHDLGNQGNKYFSLTGQGWNSTYHDMDYPAIFEDGEIRILTNLLHYHWIPSYEFRYLYREDYQNSQILIADTKSRKSYVRKHRPGSTLKLAELKDHFFIAEKMVKESTLSLFQCKK